MMKNTSHNITVLDNNNHSVFALYYHLVLVVKYRRKVFDDSVSEYAKGSFLPATSHCWNGIMTRIMYISSSRIILTVIYPDSSMRIRALPPD